MSDRPALHEDDWLLPIAADRRCCQAKHVLRPCPPQNGIEGDGANVVALIDDYLPVILDR